MALKELTTTQLRVMKKMCESMLDMLTNACRVRGGLVEFNSNTDYQSKQIDSRRDPESYYIFKWFDSYISIVADFWSFDSENHRRSKTNEWCYHIHVVNCRIALFDSKKSFSRCPYDMENGYYGNFPSLDVAICWYKRAIMSFLINNLKYQLQGDLFENL